ncbi:TIGR03790 family protein [Desulfoluna sp.]|uniref:TIGR03790 family protein n=1 Tax=Desulfoluna sp. TaxID=2045199 RepID=UPI0026286EEB|nr:TIGR03790 family protein [Desulfoluna sp.]
MNRRWVSGLSGLFFFLVAPSVWALSPSEVAVVFNKAVPVSETLADEYMALRGIPSSQKIALFVSDTERIDRNHYETRIAEPVRLALLAMPRIQCLVTMYGVPLTVVDPGLTPSEMETRQRLAQERLVLEAKRAAHPDDKGLDAEWTDLQQRVTQAQRARDKNASVDSELMLVKRPGSPLSFWVANPLFAARRGQARAGASEVLLVSRLDAPEPATVRRLMADAVDVEGTGLSGTAYFDARWKMPGKKDLGGYALYDRSIHRSADALETQAFLTVVKDAREALFSPRSCPDAALYCGWYSLGTYVDAFDWKKGAVGYHIASSECTTLKNASSSIWCVQMLQRGVAATIGPVGEPYVQAFPMPEMFFGFLADGRLTLVECYAASLPFLSWKMVLVGDPLYRPFYAKPALRNR